jgi:hypothetical protein
VAQPHTHGDEGPIAKAERVAAQLSSADQPIMPGLRSTGSPRSISDPPPVAVTLTSANIGNRSSLICVKPIRPLMLLSGMALENPYYLTLDEYLADRLP